MSEIQRALFTVKSGQHKGRTVNVHFNPVSLKHTIENTLEDSSGGSAKQYVKQSTAKLKMELVFDTTHDGSDIRRVTDQIAQFLQPDNQKVPPIVLFEWGVYKFQGMLESFDETLDFFSPNGVPLRAAVNISLSSQDKVFENSNYSSFDQQDSLTPDVVDVPAPSAPTGGSNGQAVTDLASRGGDAMAGRAIASANGLETMRFASGPLTVDASVTLEPPTAFASGGIGLSAGGGVSGGISVVASASIGAKASAGVSATQGAFSGLKTSIQKPTLKLNPVRLVSTGSTASLGGSKSFQVGGQASGGSSGLSANVGANADLKARIQFQEK
jgi:Contractile injection system tube protein